jgi:S1-C subfamily serine protease
MKRSTLVSVIAMMVLFTSSLSDNREGGRGLASAWNVIPSRSLSGLHYVFKDFQYNDELGSVRVSGPVIEITRGEKAGSKIFSQGYSLEMDQEDFEQEQYYAQSIFQARSGSGRTVGTAFLVGRDLVLTNRHLMGILPGDKKWNCGAFSLLLNHKEERIDCLKVRYCSSRFDFCVVQMNKMKNGLALNSEVRPLRLARWIRPGDDVDLLHIGNAAGLGLQASRGKGLRVSGGEFHHFVPTLSGSSGAPLINEKGQVVGINWGHTGKDFVDDHSFNRGVLSSAIFEELKRTHPFTLREIKSFKSWSSRDNKKHRQVRVESHFNSRPK